MLISEAEEVCIVCAAGFLLMCASEPEINTRRKGVWRVCCAVAN